MRTYKPSETIYWELSNGTMWQLKPIGLGNYSVETEVGFLPNPITLTQARETAQKMGMTIKDEG